MRNFFERFSIFMQGRYGFDTLNGFLFVLMLIIWFANLFVFNITASLIMYLIQLALLGWAVFRTLSRNINMRSKENRSFCKVYNPAKSKVQFTWKRFRDRKDFRYLKCPVCKSQLRVRNKKGRHTVRCPRCGSEFEKKI